MKLAITICRKRVSPLFESAETVLIVDLIDGKEIDRQSINLGGLSVSEKVAKLVGLDVDVLICGAVQVSVRSLLEKEGLRVFPWVVGRAADVLNWPMGRNLSSSNAEGSDVMVICVSSTGPDLDSPIDPRFGRCSFLIFSRDDSTWEAVENPNGMLSGGAGIKSAQLIIDRDACILLTGNCGPNAFGTLSAAGVQVFTGADGTVGEAIERYKRGELTSATVPTVAGHPNYPVSGQGFSTTGTQDALTGGRGRGRGRGGRGGGQGGGFGGGGQGRGQGRGGGGGGSVS